MKRVTISVIIPVLNEQENINKVISHLSGLQEDCEPEIIVVDGSADGFTLNIIRDESIIKLSSDPGRAVQMNKGAVQAKGRILLFLHADTVLPDNAFSLIVESLDDQKRAGAFRLKIDSTRWFLSLAAALTNLRSRWQGTPYGDQAQFFIKEYFYTIGAFKEIPLFEDLEIMQRIRKRREKISIVKQKVLTSARRWEKEGMLYGTFRNRVISFLFNIGVSPKKLVKYYNNQKDEGKHG